MECPPRDKFNGDWSWQDRFENDIWYVQNLSFIVDCKMVINMFRYALDPKMSSMRANAKLGTFMGYTLDGIAITKDDIEDKYYEMLLENKQSPVSEEQSLS